MAVKTWIADTGDWNVAGNWSPSGEPSPVDEAIIDNGGTANLPGNKGIGIFRMSNGSSLTAVASLNFQVNDDMFVDADANSIDPDITVIMTGLVGDAPYTLSCGIDLGGVTINAAGKTIVSGSDLTITDHLNVAAGTFDCNGYDLYIAHRITISGTFVAGVGKIEFIDAEKDSTIETIVTFNDFVCNTPGKTIKFKENLTQVINGSLIIQGTYGNEIELLSMSSPTQWGINNVGNSENVDYASIKDSSPVLSNDITADYSIDGGNNDLVSPGWVIVPPSEGFINLVDNNTTTDMHGLVAGTEYKFNLWVYIPSTGGPLASEVTLDIDDYYSGAWHDNPSDPASGQDEWVELTVTHTINAAATGIRIRIIFAISAAETEYCYVDTVGLLSKGVHNEHGQNFLDTGVHTFEFGNSWQVPF